MEWVLLHAVLLLLCLNDLPLCCWRVNHAHCCWMFCGGSQAGGNSLLASGRTLASDEYWLCTGYRFPGGTTLSSSCGLLIPLCVFVCKVDLQVSTLFDYIRFDSIIFGSIIFGSIWFDYIRFDSIRFDSIQFDENDTILYVPRRINKQKKTHIFL